MNYNGIAMDIYDNGECLKYFYIDIQMTPKAYWALDITLDNIYQPLETLCDNIDYVIEEQLKSDLNAEAH